MTAQSQTIGVIGTGIMGGPMAANLLKAGYRVLVHNRTKSRTQPLLDSGAVWADTPAAAAAEADVVLTCLPNTPDVQQVLLGPSGVLETARKGLICIDTSTICPDASRTIAARLKEKDIIFFDAPVSGGQIGAIEGKLSIMIGGPREHLETIRPILEVLGRSLTYCGPVGAGQMTKLTNQILVIHTVVSIAEGLVFAKKAGLNLETTLSAVLAGAGYSHSLKHLGPKILAGDWRPAFKVDLQLKDLDLVLNYARRIGQPLPATALVRELLSILSAQGRGQDGTQALFDVIDRMGKEKRPPETPTA